MGSDLAKPVSLVLSRFRLFLGFVSLLLFPMLVTLRLSQADSSKMWRLKIAKRLEEAATHHNSLKTSTFPKEKNQMSTVQVPAIDMNKLNAFIGQFVTDLGAAVHTGMVVIGEKLGLYKALAEGPMSSAQLAAKTQTDERYLREWLASQAAGGYITYDEQSGRFSLSDEQAFTLADDNSPAYLPGAFEL